jgi:CAAX prenyl protease-like protein
VWVAPQAFFGAAPRAEGFQPHFFGADGAAYWTNLLLRFARMTLIVPLVEELFWRGFLLRFCIREDFQRVPFGTFTWTSFLVVSIAFCFEHTQPDWAAALITSALYNAVAYTSRSLLACVIAHAITNLLLGFYIMKTQQWGFW